MMKTVITTSVGTMGAGVMKYVRRITTAHLMARVGRMRVAVSVASFMPNLKKLIDDYN